MDLVLAAGRLGGRLKNPANLREHTGARDPRRPLPSGRPCGARARALLVRRLSRLLARDGDGPRRPLRVLLAYAPGVLAPDARPPADPVLAEAFGVPVRVFARLYGSRVRALGRLPFVDVEGLLAEARRGRRGRAESGRRPGPLGRELAVDSRLIRLASRALGRRFAPGLEARYLFYSKPGDYFWPHPDDPMYAANVLVCLERVPPADGGPPSAFFVARPDGSFRRIELRPGEALAAEARGVVHGREPLRRGERVTLLSIELVKC